MLTIPAFKVGQRPKQVDWRSHLHFSIRISPFTDQHPHPATPTACHWSSTGSRGEEGTNKQGYVTGDKATLAGRGRCSDRGFGGRGWNTVTSDLDVVSRCQVSQSHTVSRSVRGNNGCSERSQPTSDQLRWRGGGRQFRLHFSRISSFYFENYMNKDDPPERYSRQVHRTKWFPQQTPRGAAKKIKTILLTSDSHCYLKGLYSSSHQPGDRNPTRSPEIKLMSRDFI